jgi:hypothetical protein
MTYKERLTLELNFTSLIRQRFGQETLWLWAIPFNAPPPPPPLMNFSDGWLQSHFWGVKPVGILWSLQFFWGVRGKFTNFWGGFSVGTLNSILTRLIFQSYFFQEIVHDLVRLPLPQGMFIQIVCLSVSVSVSVSVPVSVLVYFYIHCNFCLCVCLPLPCVYCMLCI